MNKRSFRFQLFSLSLALMLLLSACAGAANNPGANNAALPNTGSQSDDMQATTPAATSMMEDETPMATEMMGEETPMATEMMDDHGTALATEMMEDKDKMMAEGTPAATEMMDAGGTAVATEMMSDTTKMEAGMLESPAFFSVPLTDVTSGETFTLADMQGKVVLVETLAMWCPSCLRQQQEVQALHALLGERDDFASVGLDIDPNENAADLKGYVMEKGFNWQYAVAPAEVSREIGQLYGEQFLNPPSTPMFIIDRHGQVHPLPFGIKSAEELQQALQPFLDEPM